VTEPVYEQWTNPQWVTPCTVPAGAPGTGDGVASGDLETWDMAGGWAAFGGANEGPPYPEEQFRVFDLHAPSEIILVRQTSGTTTRAQDRRRARRRLTPRSVPGPVWQVTRGDQGTTPAAHLPGFAVLNAVTGPALTNSLAAGTPGHNGLVLPAAGRRGPAAPWTDNAWHPVAELPVPAGEATPGAVYELTAFGIYQASTNGGGQAVSFDSRWAGATDVQLTLGSWNIQTLGGVLGQVCRWRVHTLIKIYADSFAHGSTLLHLAGQNSTTGVQMYDLISAPTVLAGSAIDTAGPATVSVRAQLPNNLVGTPGPFTLWGSKAWKAG
jgi:hypothetical protein